MLSTLWPALDFHFYTVQWQGCVHVNAQKCIAVINMQCCDFAAFGNEKCIFPNFKKMLTWKWGTAYSHNCFHSLKASVIERGILYQNVSLHTKLLYKVDFYEIFQNNQTVKWCSIMYIVDHLHLYNTWFVHQL